MIVKKHVLYLYISICVLSHVEITFQYHLKIRLLLYIIVVSCIRFIIWIAYLCTFSIDFPQIYSQAYFFVLNKEVLINLHMELYANFLHCTVLKLKLKCIILINPTCLVYLYIQIKYSYCYFKC